MAAPYESVEEALRALTATTGEGAEQVYAKWAVLSLGPDDDLERLVKRKLVLNAKSAQVKESLTATVRAGGGVGENLLEMLNKTGLTGFS